MLPVHRAMPLTAVLLLGLIGGSFHPGRAQEPGSLTGRELRPKSDDPRSILGELLLGGGGKIEKVVVKEDGERRLTITVTFSRLAGRQLAGELLGSDRRTQRQFHSTPVDVKEGDASAELIFEPDASLPEGTPVDSAYLRLTVQRSDLPVPESDRNYALAKRWLIPVPPERQVLKITPRPVGTAAQLRDRPVITLPPRQVSIPPRVSTVAPGLTRRAQPAATARPLAMAQPAATLTTLATQNLTIQRQILVQTQPVVATLPVNTRMIAFDHFAFGVKTEDAQRGAQGPGPSRLDILESLRSDPPVALDSILPLSNEVYQDRNPSSGIFYFLPQDYHLRWDPDEGYSFRMLYSAASGEGQAGSVMMATRIDAGVDTGGVNLAEDLLRAYSARHPETKFTALRPLPIDAPPAVSLSGGLEHQYDIPADKIVIHAISDALGQIDVSWVTDAVTKQNLQLALVEDVGINGNISFTPSGGGLPARSLPVAIEIADSHTFGGIPWRHGDLWRNRTAYPVRLKFLRALLIENNVPIIYSWDLGSTEVPPKAQADLDGAAVPAWLDARAKRMWIEYAVARDCRSCDDQVVAGITGGVTSLGSSQITFHTITPLADTGAYEIRVAVRSKYFDPRLRDLQTKPELVLSADNKDFTIGPVYLINRQPGQPVPGDPLFEYQLAVTLPSGESFTASHWTAADSLRVLIGKVQIQQALGFLPGAPKP